MRRGLLACSLSAVIVSAGFLGAGSAAASPHPAAAVPAGCGFINASVIRSDNQFVIRIADPWSAAPQERPFGTLASAPALQSLSNAVYDDDPMGPPVYIRNWAYGTTANTLQFVYAHDENGTLSATMTSLASRWGGFRQLIYAGFMGALPSNQLYGLNANGFLYRYRWPTAELSMTAPASAGRVGGFADIRTMALVGRTSTYDALLANTNSGALVLLKIPLSTPMTVTRIVLRTRTWQVFNHLVVADCMSRDGSTTLLATNTATGKGFVYNLAHLTGPSSGIYPLGSASGTWADPFIIDSTFTDTVPGGA